MEKVQFRISDKDQVLHDLVSRMKRQEELTGKRGYVANRLRDMIKAYHLISEHFGEQDPYKLMMKIASHQKPEEGAEELPEEEDNRVDSNMYLQQFDNFANM
jgi:hypothetical protein